MQDPGVVVDDKGEAVEEHRSRRFKLVASIAAVQHVVQRHGVPASNEPRLIPHDVLDLGSAVRTQNGSGTNCAHIVHYAPAQPDARASGRCEL